MIQEIVAYYLNSSDLAGMFSLDNLFLMFIGLVWLSIAVIQDFRKREVANWWSFSLIVFALGFRAFMSINSWNYGYFLWGVIGLVATFILANLFYYARMFAGGDFKLLFAFGAVLPLASDWNTNLIIFLSFILLFILTGSLYGFVYSIVLSCIHHRELASGFKKNLKIYPKLVFLVTLGGLVILIVSWIYSLLLGILLGTLLFISPFLLVYARAIEDCCMIKKVRVRDLTVGDWTMQNIKVGRGVIKPNWEGLSEEDLKVIQSKLGKNKQISVKEGIPFTPAFLLGFVALIVLLYLALY